MKIAVLPGAISRVGGGISEVAYRLTKRLSSYEDISLMIFGLRSEYDKEDLVKWQPVPVNIFEPRKPKSFAYMPTMKSAILKFQPDILHSHMLWTYQSYLINRVHMKNDIPYMVTIHGALDNWALKKSYIKKQIALKFFERNALSHARCLHALNENEYNSIREFGLKNPVCIIPNGVDIVPNNDILDNPPWKGLFSKDNNVMLFLSRIHPKKGLEELIDAWGKVHSKAIEKRWKLVIVGWGEESYISLIKKKIMETNLDQQIFFLPPQYGEDKITCYKNADAFILPSHSEGLPMVILEAWSHSMPVLMTEACNLDIGFTTNAAFRIANNDDKLSEQLNLFFNLPNADRLELGRNGYNLVKSHFTWGEIAKELSKVYRWLNGNGTLPDSVLLK